MFEAKVPVCRSACEGGGTCVEVADDGGRVLFRDSKDPQGPVLVFTVEEWDAFAEAVKKGEFDDIG